MMKPTAVGMLLITLELLQRCCGTTIVREAPNEDGYNSSSVTASTAGFVSTTVSTNSTGTEPFVQDPKQPEVVTTDVPSTVSTADATASASSDHVANTAPVTQPEKMETTSTSTPTSDASLTQTPEQNEVTASDPPNLSPTATTSDETRTEEIVAAGKVTIDKPGAQATESAVDTGARYSIPEKELSERTETETHPTSKTEVPIEPTETSALQTDTAAINGVKIGEPSVLDFDDEVPEDESPKPSESDAQTAIYSVELLADDMVEEDTQGNATDLDGHSEYMTVATQATSTHDATQSTVGDEEPLAETYDEEKVNNSDTKKPYQGDENSATVEMKMVPVDIIETTKTSTVLVELLADDFNLENVSLYEPESSSSAAQQQLNNDNQPALNDATTLNAEETDQEQVPPNETNASNFEECKMDNCNDDPIQSFNDTEDNKQTATTLISNSSSTEQATTDTSKENTSQTSSTEAYSYATEIVLLADDLSIPDPPEDGSTFGPAAAPSDAPSDVKGLAPESSINNTPGSYAEPHRTEDEPKPVTQDPPADNASSIPTAANTTQVPQSVNKTFYLEPFEVLELHFLRAEGALLAKTSPSTTTKEPVVQAYPAESSNTNRFGETYDLLADDFAFEEESKYSQTPDETPDVSDTPNVENDSTGAADGSYEVSTTFVPYFVTDSYKPTSKAATTLRCPFAVQNPGSRVANEEQVRRAEESPPERHVEEDPYFYELDPYCLTRHHILIPVMPVILPQWCFVPDTPDFMCPRYDLGFHIAFPHETNRGMYYRCVYGQAILFTCPNLHDWDDERKICSVVTDFGLARQRPHYHPSQRLYDPVVHRHCQHCRRNFLKPQDVDPNAQCSDRMLLACNTDGTLSVYECPGFYFYDRRIQLRWFAELERCDYPADVDGPWQR
uniref:Chitin-binding type-2 domain-containing protein n=1 Tax=Anopheles farauti TaxID=69004 RepID=A0A182QDP3_9DIPT